MTVLPTGVNAWVAAKAGIANALAVRAELQLAHL